MRMGMIGLGRMGANMSVRLMKAKHEIVAFDVSADSVKALAAQGAIAATSIEDMIAKLPAPRSIWMMIPTAYVDETIAKIAPHLSKGDTLIDGGSLTIAVNEENPTGNRYGGIFIAGRGETTDPNSIQPLGGIYFYNGVDDLGSGAGDVGSPNHGITVPKSGDSLDIEAAGNGIKFKIRF